MFRNVRGIEQTHNKKYRWRNDVIIKHSFAQDLVIKKNCSQSQAPHKLDKTRASLHNNQGIYWQDFPVIKFSPSNIMLPLVLPFLLGLWWRWEIFKKKKWKHHTKKKDNNIIKKAMLWPRFFFLFFFSNTYHHHKIKFLTVWDP